MKTDYELIKDFPKVLYHVNLNGDVEEVKVRDAHFCGKYGIEINLGEGRYIYERTHGSHKRNIGYSGDYYEYYGESCYNRFVAFYVNKKRAYEAAEMHRKEVARRDKKDQIFSAYCETKNAGGILTFDFSKR